MANEISTTQLTKDFSKWIPNIDDEMKTIEFTFHARTGQTIPKVLTVDVEFTVAGSSEKITLKGLKAFNSKLLVNLAPVISRVTDFLFEVKTQTIAPFILEEWGALRVLNIKFFTNNQTIATSLNFATALGLTLIFAPGNVSKKTFPYFMDYPVEILGDGTEVYEAQEGSSRVEIPIKIACQDYSVRDINSTGFLISYTYDRLGGTYKRVKDANRSDMPIYLKHTLYDNPTTLSIGKWSQVGVANPVISRTLKAVSRPFKRANPYIEWYNDLGGTSQQEVNYDKAKIEKKFKIINKYTKDREVLQAGVEEMETITFFFNSLTFEHYTKLASIFRSSDIKLIKDKVTRRCRNVGNLTKIGEQRGDIAIKLEVEPVTISNKL